MSVRLPPEFDTERSAIQIFADWDTGRYIKTVHPALPHDARNNHDTLMDYYALAEETANRLWLEKYGEPMPPEVDGQWAQTLAASAIPYDGNVKLTDAEWQRVCGLTANCDITLDMLWFVVEGLGWRPGRPVPKTDPLWEEVWRKDVTDSSGYIDLVYLLLDMPEPLPSVDDHISACLRFGKLFDGEPIPF